jgi:valyl-tRNA synthetase
MTFHPDRYARTYHSWHAGIRDWCVSRQLWWGHQIPVWVKVVAIDDADEAVTEALRGAELDEARPVDSRWVDSGAAHLVRKMTDTEVEEAVCVPPQSTLQRLDRPDTSLDEPGLVAALEADGYHRDPDVLDTWFSSGLWPMSTMGWPWPEDFPETVGLLEAFNPTSVLMTAREIITLWVSRMTMFNRYFLDGQLAFDDVFIHAMIQDGHGQKMSKSLGNGVDPRDIIESHGADAMRYTLAKMTTDTQDVRMPVDMVCAHTGEMFTPEFITTSAGHVVAAPIQGSPSDPTKKMISSYGLAVGEPNPGDELPVALNTSSKFDEGRNFANKVWNATRFALGRIPADPASAGNGSVDLADATFADRWIVARLAETLAVVENALASYQFNVYADALYDFIWRDVCDRYLEAVKPTIDDNEAQQATLGAVLDSVLRILHPVCPFITEALWPHVSAVRTREVTGLALPASDLVATASWPTVADGTVDDGVIDTFERADQLIGAIRAIRSERKVKPKKLVTLHAPAAVLQLIEAADGAVETLAGLGQVDALDDADRPAVASPLAFEGSEVLVSGLVDEMDLDAERARLQKLIEAKAKQVDGFENRLANPGYVNNAKPELVAETRDLLQTARNDLEAAEAAMAALG